MNRIVIETKYIKLYYNDVNQIYSWKLLPETEHMGINKLKETFELVMSTMKNYSPRYVMADDRENKAIFIVDVQEWIAKITIETLMYCQVERFAIVLPQEFINELATKQAVDEAQKLAKGIEIETFTDISVAKMWLKGHEEVKDNL